MYYRRVEAGESSKAYETQSKSTKVVNKPEVTVSNSFDALDMAEKEDVVPSDFRDKREDVLNASDSEVDEEIMVEQRRGVATFDFTTKGASTPITETSNGSWCDKGTRIIVGWNYNDVDVVVITQDAQAIHTRIWLKAERKELYIRNHPWCLLGDFNAALFLEDSTASGANIDISMREFRDCVEDIEVMDVHRMGLQFTWNQKPKGANGILKKIDRIMANTGFHDQFVGAHAIFKPYRISDHSPSVLCLPTLCKEKLKPFKFFNVLTKHERFKEFVNEGWVNQISGFHILRSKLDSIRSLLDADPFNANLREAEASCVVEFNQAVLWGDDKSPGLDGYTACFFKADWEVVADDVTNAICVPLVSSRLLIRDCVELIDRVQTRIQDWKNKSLSAAGRLQLIRSVLGAMHIYWASVFILPSRVLLNIEQLMRGFLWSPSILKKRRSKVAWEKLLSLKESLWVKWIHEYKLKGRSFWDIPLRGDEAATSLWFD
ncbi:RNA-directed DNA polymerase, eukaryota, reverse transcriptase zinc-binding domain protein [Tanacetum coccineum]